MSVWSDIITAGEHIQKISATWAKNISPGEWTMKCVGDLDGTIVVLYFIQEQSRVIYARLGIPRVGD